LAAIPEGTTTEPKITNGADSGSVDDALEGHGRAAALVDYERMWTTMAEPPNAEGRAPTASPMKRDDHENDGKDL
jgi:hypothetical protein